MLNMCGKHALHSMHTANKWPAYIIRKYKLHALNSISGKVSEQTI